MSHAEQVTPPAPENMPEVSAPEPVPPAPVSAPSSGLQCGPLRGLIAAVAAGAISWGILHATFPVFSLPPELLDVQPTSPPELQQRQSAALEQIRIKHAIFVMGLLGLSLGLFLSFAESQARGQLAWAPLTGLLGAVIAAAGGCSAGVVGYFVYRFFQRTSDYDPLQETIMLQAVMLGILGISVGIAVALPYRRVGLLINCVVGGLLGGVVASLIYPVGMATFFRLANTESLTPHDSMTRLAWLGTAAILVGLVITGMGKRQKKQ